MLICLDSGVAIKSVVPEPDSQKAIDLLAQIQQGVHDAIAPDIFPLETANALLKAERLGRVVDAIGMWTALMLDCPLLHPQRSHFPRAFEIATATRIAVYDALYVALAEQEGCDMVTADERLVRSVKKDFPFVVSLASLQP